MCADGLARQRRHEFRLAIARHAGDADDFAGAHGKVDSLEGGAEGIA